ncbi:protein lin-54 homolog isoform X1 [Bombina bombina]|uniref:protein lin-54 homolog isoform X1 n=1 Tax=Bombina bombina TaxID=8345 RepID=UPI00235A8660|nr:protein lin-54 homolog isoform X1 [Bombina bombina]
MDVVSAEVNNVLPDEIMETEMSLEDDDSIEAITITSPMVEDVPMETELDEIVEVNSSGDCVTTTLSEETVSTSNHSGHLAVLSVASKPDSGPSVAAMKTVIQSGLHKLATPVPGQMIINKVTQASEIGPGSHILKQEGQKLFVTTLGKSNQPYVLTLPQNTLSNTQTGATHFQTVDAKGTPQQIRVVTIGGRTEGKPVLGMSSLTSAQLIGSTTKSPVLQAQQIKTLQIAKQIPASSSGAVKLIIQKPVNSKPLTTGQISHVSSVFAGKNLSHTNPGTPPKSITITETGVIGASLTSTQTSNKIAISPLKSPSKLTLVSVGSQPHNSPQKTVSVPISVALGQQLLTVQTPSSPGKAITNSTSAQGGKQTVQSIAVGGVNTPQFKTIIPLSAAPNIQQIQVPGSKFHYVRLVTASTGSSSNLSSQSTSTQALHQAKPMMVNATSVRMSVPIVSAQTVKQVAPKPLNSASHIVTTSQPQQRLLMPATPLPQIQPNLTNLPPGTVLAPAPGTGNVGYAVLPAQYVTQLQQPSYVSIASNAGLSATPSVQNQPRVPLNGIISSESSRPRKPCNCTKSLCLKLYCDCFANGEFCNNCNCTNCYNNLDHENERQKAIKACLDRNPEAFKPKIGKGKEGESDRRHSKGCNCKRSGCLKNYCECYEAKIMCSSICKCIGCKNFEESPERKTLMHLADAAEVRVQQQTAAKTKLSSQISDLLTRPAPSLSSGGGKLPFTFITKEVSEATCDCLLAQAEQAEKQSKCRAAAERMILEEFGRCLMRVIDSAGKAKSDPCPMSC